METFPKFRADTRAPARPPPPQSWDCHVHVLADPARYPYRSGWPFMPPVVPPTDADIDALRRMHSTLGIARGVLVQPGLYGSDHRLLLDTLRATPNYRGIAHIREPIDNRELRAMHEAGVRGIRFNFWHRMDEAPNPELFRRLCAQIADYGWHVKIQAVGEDWLRLKDLLLEIKIPAVIDHLGSVDAKLGLGQASVPVLLDLLHRENWWMLVVNGDRRSDRDGGWEDIVPFARRYLELAPDRCIWASDWPHLGYRKTMPNDADLLDLLDRYAPEPALRKKILADNPARLFDFTGGIGQ